MTRPRSILSSRPTAFCRRCPKLALIPLLVGALGSSARAEDTSATPSPTPVPAPSPAPDPGISDALRLRIDKLEAEVEELKLHQRSTPAAVFRIGAATAQFTGFVQADGTLYHQASADEIDYATGDPLNVSRFTIPRARLRLGIDSKWVAAVLEFDGNTIHGATARITNAEVSFQWRPDAAKPAYLMISAGLLRIPFGFEVQQVDYQRLFIDRAAVIRALFPGEFDLGLRVQGGWRMLRYQFAALNGNPAGDRMYAARDPNESKDFLGRIGIDSKAGKRVHLGAGVSALYGTGFHVGTPSTKSTLVWQDANLDGQVDPTELIGVLGQPATASENFHRYALGADLQLQIEVPKLGPLLIVGELVWGTNLDRALVPADPVARGRDLRELGWYLGFTQSLTRWAMIGLRYDRYDPDADASERVGARLLPRDATFSTIAVAVAAVYAPYGRLVLEYDRNTNPLGRTITGEPTTLGSDVVTLRAQVTF